MASTYVARHNMSIDGSDREAGELVPEAATWDRLQSSLSTGFLRPVDVPDAVFVAAVRKYCPKLSKKLAEINGLDFADFPEEDDPDVTPRPDPEVDPTINPTIEEEHVIVHPDAPAEQDVVGDGQPKGNKERVQVGSLSKPAGVVPPRTEPSNDTSPAEDPSHIDKDAGNPGDAPDVKPKPAKKAAAKKAPAKKAPAKAEEQPKE